MTSRAAGGCARRSAGRLSARVSEPVRWACVATTIGGDALARARELLFEGLQRASSARDAGFGFAVAKPRRFSALRLPLRERRRKRDGSLVGAEGMLNFGVSDWAATRSLLGLEERCIPNSAETRPPAPDVRCCTHHSPLRHRSTRRFVDELTSRIS
jgi:hypothetical protein